MRATPILSVCNILSFLELLLLFTTGISTRVLINYVSAIKAVLKLYMLPHHLLDSVMIQNYIKAIMLEYQGPVKVKGLFSLQQLAQMSQVLSLFPLHHHFRAAFLLALMGFLRISNLSPSAASDSDKQLPRKDITFTSFGAILNLRLAKNMQKYYQHHVNQIPRMKSPLLCPITVLHALHQIEKHAPNDLVLKCGNSVITESQLRKRLVQLLKVMGMPTAGHLFHTFRKSGASLAFNLGYLLKALKIKVRGPATPFGHIFLPAQWERWLFQEFFKPLNCNVWGFSLCCFKKTFKLLTLTDTETSKISD